MQGRFWGDRVEIKRYGIQGMSPLKKLRSWHVKPEFQFSGKDFLSRRMDCAEKIDKFLNSTLEDLNDPFLLKDMDVAAERISKAVRKREKILIYGDYDVDGCYQHLYFI